MSARLHYSVRATFDDVALRDAFETWLRDGHVAEVMRAGEVLHAAILREEGLPLRVECRYVFASRQAFQRYDAGPAEQLRAEGRARFAFGVTFERKTAIEILSQ